jgi:DNA-binding HxlR family transcriptional regulator
MSVDKPSLNSLSRRSFGLPVLKLLTEDSSINFGLLMEKLQISKKGLYITLKDLEEDGLIVKERIGKKTFIKITKEGEIALVQQIQHTQENQGLIEEIVEETLVQLEEEGIISQEWSESDHKEFIAKLKTTLLNKRAVSGDQD